MRPDDSLRPMTPAHLPLRADWLATPHAVQWWEHPAERRALVTADLDEPLMDQHSAHQGARTFGCLQRYSVHAWPAGAPRLADFPPGSAAMDCFIGPPNMLGQGHGTQMRLHAQHLLAQGAPAVAIDPDPDNERAVRAYRRAGFAAVARHDDAGGDLTLVLRFAPFTLA